MSIPFSNTYLRIPQGFGNLLEGLTREILREQPENIPAFAAAYFKDLLEKREKTNFDPAEWGAKIDDRFYNNHAFKDQQIPEKQEPDQERHQESSEENKEEIAAVKIQAAFRGHMAREEIKKMKSGKPENGKEENE
ncbi:PREDICTED: sperm surface protein Sp17 [Chinchilla lanigera]|uniref:Sperm surface protein Sp17 n=1 Tax=Chinchilla lanigera TaxID=34839 RepID=A0A8C2W1D0_CHILA|nr:PREDICTED: sperm surface protein Sp17 [Chinchilla lanigera]